ncbi:MAG: thiol-disulfide oxidoreductase DCC family protein [Chitinophagaceae bacterium]|nr:thiol-disulfide oxidoreductase DCC family protein [Chitinophagaceae bacterium]MCA6456081.1 thiol-disulfide oxidoreductase DCC family protein [Chitinophagaceae bacterium]MCA6458149.1 thiol-disulfide oxidoreductase DCC family protein [Chitinophagaceae bacterium]MCA6463862.1 thiol-disulfide oxidoreductase DCC family protein [Chitinophagaceae bacterium]MEA3425084.1 thiol-disulfide oxidoreductase DCC family protein [Bacteroidota bacterium]
MHTHPILFFDGLCNLCTASVQFIIRHDPKQRFRFASLQSTTARSILGQSVLATDKPDSFLLWENGTVYSRSEAALRVTKRLSGAWPLLYVFRIVPVGIRDGIYNIVARNRYRWFGRKNECWVPSAALQQLFLE